MRDHNQILRTAVYQCLNGRLENKAGDDVDIFDEKVQEKCTHEYVLMSVQNTVPIPIFSGFMSRAFILVKIMTKEKDSVSKDIVDYIANQIVYLLKPSPTTDGLVQQAGFQINCLQIETMAYNEAQLTNTKTEICHLLRVQAVVTEK
jgi:hypothetical protein